MLCIAIRNIAFKVLKISSRHMLTCSMDNHKCKSVRGRHHHLSKYEPFPLPHYHLSKYELFLMFHYQGIQKRNRLKKNGNTCNHLNENRNKYSHLNEGEKSRNRSNENRNKYSRLNEGEKSRNR